MLEGIRNSRNAYTQLQCTRVPPATILWEEDQMSLESALIWQ